MEKKKYPVGAENYKLYEEVGQGVSASVFRAKRIPNNEIVAIKILDFECSNSDLSHCSFVNDHNLWVVTPFMPGGSYLHILKSAHPDGFEEVVIATILREVLKALEYLHDHAVIHQDVKAGNILISDNGAIKLGDLGVSACLFDSGNRQRMRNTFVGTPCWMAPEVMEQLHGYDFKSSQNFTSSLVTSIKATQIQLQNEFRPDVLGIEFLLEKGLPPILFKTSVIGLRTVNNVLRGMSFVMLARITGSQSSGAEKKTEKVDSPS
ncbi:hypothetical protein M8C21_021637 [Ambrosia artemisiifolia]|uniref:Protein kinase domain-containing protein n=1 Tax=Ambrosia artemisiifolia TaxID=4212 RepID=A0AAD5CXY3_AMBAR|nr:hypothetical protein M8C21_021637 [Ambrosia artemisiifolia]